MNCVAHARHFSEDYASLLYIIRVVHTELRVDTAGTMKLQARSLPCDIVLRISGQEQGNKDSHVAYTYVYAHNTSKKSRNHVIM